MPAQDWLAVMVLSLLPGCICLPETNAQWAGRDKDFRPLLKGSGSTAPIHAGMSKNELLELMGRPAESFDNDRRLLYKYTTRKGAYLQPWGHGAGFHDLYRDRFLLIWLDPPDQVRALRFLEQPYFNNADDEIDGVITRFKIGPSAPPD